MNRPHGRRVRPRDEHALAPLVARAVRARRIEMGITIAQLADAIDSSASNVCRFEGGKSTDMLLGFLERVAHALETTVTDLLRQAESRRSLVHDESHTEEEATGA